MSGEATRENLFDSWLLPIFCAFTAQIIWYSLCRKCLYSGYLYSYQKLWVVAFLMCLVCKDGSLVSKGQKAYCELRLHVNPCFLVSDIFTLYLLWSQREIASDTRDWADPLTLDLCRHIAVYLQYLQQVQRKTIGATFTPIAFWVFSTIWQKKKKKKIPDFFH